jgi:CelD/BcsL family acetyltransferase involved in cellulose biosynthesis
VAAVTTVRVERIDPLADPRWSDVSALPQATLYHSMAWARVLRASYGFRAHYYLALDAERVVGGLPFFEVGSALRRKRLVSLPFSDVGGHVGEPSTVSPLLSAALRDADARGWRTVEIRGGRANGAASGLTQTHHNDLYTLPLDRSLRDIVGGFSDSVRWGRKRALRDGVSAERISTVDGLREFYALHQITRRRLGVPVQSWRFFEHLGREFLARDNGFVVNARRAGRAVASAVFLRHGSRLYYKFSATDPGALALQPNSLVLWEAIEWAHAQGLAEIDLGKTVRENVGLARFKRSWGAVPAPLPHYYFPRVAGVGAASEESSPMRAVRAVWRHLPLPVARVVGGLVYRVLA